MLQLPLIEDIGYNFAVTMVTANLKKPFKTNPIFARHETFHPRFGWLKKGFDKAVENPHVFLSDTAPTILGVGKNMANAIKYWCLAYKVIEEVHERGKGRYFIPTELGKKLLSGNGWDPYLEDVASLWHLHWQILRPPCYATAWYYTFNIFNKHVFTAEDIQQGLIEHIEREFSGNRITQSSLVKDVNCILRMYVEQANPKQISEDSIDSPFTELGLIKHYGDARHFAMDMGFKIGLRPEIVVSACLDYVSIVEEGARTISIPRLTYDQGSPGQCFKLTENLISEAIDTVSNYHPELSLSETAGLVQFSFMGDPVILSENVLSRYYSRKIVN